MLHRGTVASAKDDRARIKMVLTAIVTAQLSRARRFHEELLGLREVFWQAEIDDPTV